MWQGSSPPCKSCPPSCQPNQLLIESRQTSIISSFDTILATLATVSQSKTCVLLALLLLPSACTWSAAGTRGCTPRGCRSARPARPPPSPGRRPGSSCSRRCTLQWGSNNYNSLKTRATYWEIMFPDRLSGKFKFQIYSLKVTIATTFG